MAVGLLATVMSVAAVDTQIYETPAGSNCVGNLTVVNQGTTATIKLAITSGGAPVGQNWFEYDHSLDATEGIERSGIVLGPGERLYINASTSNFSCNFWGIEEAV